MFDAALVNTIIISKTYKINILMPNFWMVVHYTTSMLVALANRRHKLIMTTCVTHVVVVGCVFVLGQATRVIDWIRVMTNFRLWCWCCIGTQISRLHWCGGLLTGVITWLAFTHTLEHMIQSQNMTHLMDHGVVVSFGAKVGGVKNHSAWKITHRHLCSWCNNTNFHLTENWTL